jgi:hypothetical protein
MKPNNKIRKPMGEEKWICPNDEQNFKVYTRRKCKLNKNSPII